jgi:hypothetical protein
VIDDVTKRAEQSQNAVAEENEQVLSEQAFPQKPALYYQRHD